MMSSRRTGSKCSRDTCAQCRLRKVRCDGIRSVCGNCDRLGFVCSFQEVPASSPGSGVESPARARPVPRQRARRACRTCHASKTRCSGHAPSCERCKLRGIDCVYDQPKTVSGIDNLNSMNTVSSTQSSESRSSSFSRQKSPNGAGSSRPTAFLHHGFFQAVPLDKAMVMQIFDKYFQSIHPLPIYSFMHKASLFQRYSTGQLDETLLLAIAGITLQLTDNGKSPHELALLCTNAAQHRILAEIEKPSLVKIQALVFIIKQRALVQQTSASAMLLATAIRYAFALRLIYEQPSLPFLAQEARRRLMWTLFMLDTHLSGCIQEFTLCPSDVVHIRLPCREESFEIDLDEETGPLWPSDNEPKELNLGLLAFHVRVMGIRDRVLRFARKLAALRPGGAARSVDKVVSDGVAEHGNLLARFASSLPGPFTFSEYNLRLRAYSHQLPRFLMVHIWWHQCHCDLYRTFLKGHRLAMPSATISVLPRDFVTWSRQKCLQHAIFIADILSTFVGLGIDVPLMDSDITICVYHTAFILCLMLQMHSAELSLEYCSVSEKIQVCLSFLEKLPDSSQGSLLLANNLRSIVSSQNPVASMTSRSTSPVESDSEIWASNGAAGSRQFMFRNAPLRRSCFPDDSEELAMPVTSPANHKDPRQSQVDSFTAPVSTVNADSNALPNVVQAPEPPPQESVDLVANEPEFYGDITANMLNGLLDFGPWDPTTEGVDNFGLTEY